MEKEEKFFRSFWKSDEKFNNGLKRLSDFLYPGEDVKERILYIHGSYSSVIIWSILESTNYEIINLRTMLHIDDESSNEGDNEILDIPLQDKKIAFLPLFINDIFNIISITNKLYRWIERNSHIRVVITIPSKLYHNRIHKNFLKIKISDLLDYNLTNGFNSNLDDFIQSYKL